ncbi:Fmu (Sun) domain protein [Thermodesulfobium narugense DSM 14796]|uniref:Fmu (Sun) domain protein n=1 Tax=Thermodesulfobium narugense DSM 14796 TaxID=747365 RepID=M1E4W9_9BACT|nr:Fmu (Sun) domain-containing protein [Thermodesulfobium narugense]AEE14632.1 Fmu (Sun) domain protein [Thermodesulfobium narugense DSM 14796]
MSITASRFYAFKTLKRIIYQGAYLHLVTRNINLNGRDRAFFKLLVNLVLKSGYKLFEKLSKEKLSNSEVIALMMALVELKILGKEKYIVFSQYKSIPEKDFSEKRFFKTLKKLENEKNLIENEISLPNFIINQIVDSKLDINSFTKNFVSTPMTGFFVLSHSKEILDLLNSLSGKLYPGRIFKNYYYTESFAEVLGILPKDCYIVISESSMLSVLLLEPKPGEKILEVGASPGGKSVFLEYVLKNYKDNLNKPKKVISVDISESRISALKKTCEKYKLKLINPTLYTKKTVFDVSDKILIDAPCSGLSTLDSKPDIIFHLKESDIKLLAKKQEDILNYYKDFIRVKGKLVYSVCTFTEMEGKGQIEKFLQKNKNFKTFEGVLSSKYINQDIIIKDGMLDIDWNALSLEPFFICCLEKVDE